MRTSEREENLDGIDVRGNWRGAEGLEILVRVFIDRILRLKKEESNHTVGEENNRVAASNPICISGNFEKIYLLMTTRIVESFEIFFPAIVVLLDKIDY